MKTKTFFLALVLMGSSLLAVSQQTVPEPTKSNCDKKVLNKIKRQMNAVNYSDYMEISTTAKYLVTCFINENHEVELKSIEGYNEGLKQAIVEEFNDEAVSCPGEVPGTYFSFYLTFKKLPA